MFDDLTISPEMVGTPGENELAAGPFVVDHNGFISAGAYLLRHGDDLLSVYDGSRALTIDSTFTVDNDGDVLSFSSDTYDSHVSLRPVTLEDADVIFPGSTYTDVEELRADILEMLD